MSHRSLTPLSLALLLLVPAAAPAGTIQDPSTGQRFEATQKAGGKTYTCLGAGVRKVAIVKVYAVAFCVEPSLVAAVQAEAKKRHPGLAGEDLADELEEDQAFFDAVAALPGDKLVILRMVRDVSKEKMASAFRDSLGPVLSQAKIDALIAAIPGDVKDGQTVALSSAGATLTIDQQGDARKLEDADVAKKLWRVWLGEGSVAPSLKESIARALASP